MTSCWITERDLFRPGMKIQEMRELCSVIEQSMLDHEVHQRINQYNGTYLDEVRIKTLKNSDEWSINNFLLPQDSLNPILRDFSLLDNPASSTKVNVISDPSIPPTDASPPPKKFFGRGQSPGLVPEFSPLTSPAPAREIGTAKPSFDAPDSDSDGEFYSVEFPGRCCLVKHVVTVEIHPEPHGRGGDEDDGECQADSSSQGIRSPRKQVKLPSNAWDAISEVDWIIPEIASLLFFGNRNRKSFRQRARCYQLLGCIEFEFIICNSSTHWFAFFTYS